MRATRAAAAAPKSMNIGGAGTGVPPLDPPLEPPLELAELALLALDALDALEVLVLPPKLLDPPLDDPLLAEELLLPLAELLLPEPPLEP